MNSGRLLAGKFLRVVSTMGCSANRATGVKSAVASYRGFL
jgi:hypothetical protein